MPQATLSFHLPEEAAEFKLASDAGDLHSALHSVYAYVRRELKYGQNTEEAIKHLEEIRALIPYELLGP